MSRWEFMRQLEELLFDISPSEREEALQYYNDYFNDAGRENEQDVIAALGSPEQVAKIVRDGLGENAGMGEFTENGFASAGSGNQNAIVKSAQNAGNATADASTEKVQDAEYHEMPYEEASSSKNSSTEQKKEKMPTWAIVLIVIGCIFLSPFIIAIIVPVLGAIFGLLVSILGFILGIGAATIALYIAAIALLIAGFSALFVTPVIGGALIGAGLICGALGILFMMLTVFLVGTCLPAIWKGIVYIFQKLFGKKEVA